MEISLPFFTEQPYLQPPAGWLGWLVWFVWLFGLLLIANRLRFVQTPRTRRTWQILVGLLLAGLVASIFVGYRLPAWSALPLPSTPVDPRGSMLMFFAALPWLLAGFVLGPLPAAGVGLLSGLLISLWDTHHPFLMLETATLALLSSFFMRQRYRTTIFAMLREPIVAIMVGSLVYPVLFFVGTLTLPAGTLVTRLDYTLSNLPSAWLAMVGQMLIAALCIQAALLAGALKREVLGTLQPSPMESSLEARFFASITPLLLALISALMIGNWIVAGRAAEDMLQERMRNSSRLAAESLPFFLEAGQQLISQLATNPELNAENPNLAKILERNLRTVPYFTQLFFFDVQGLPIAGYPRSDYMQAGMPIEERLGIELALNGVLIQAYAIPPEPDGLAAQVSFIASVMDENAQVRGVLVGRSDLLSNPFTQPILSSLRSVDELGGQGFLVDENGIVLYHPSSSLVMTRYSGKPLANEESFSIQTAPDGTRQLVYYTPAIGRPWGIVLWVPAQRSQQIALEIAVPLLAMTLLLSLMVFVVLRFSLRIVTASLHNLTVETGRIASGNLDHALDVDGADEVAQLRRSFEQMRISLRDRLDELNRLLVVSQGVASSLEIESAVEPILQAALVYGAGMARIALLPSMMPEQKPEFGAPPMRYGAGASANLYAYLDEQILPLAREQEQVVLSNVARARLLKSAVGQARPQSLIAIALRYENDYYGILWVAYDQPHQFGDEEIRFLTTLAGQAALAVSNARLFLTAEIGRQRLAAILASTPDPVLVTDDKNHLLLANPVSWQVFGLDGENSHDQPIEKVITHPNLLEILRSNVQERQTIEVVLNDGRTYLATASSIDMRERRVGRVCILRDVTYFKEIDALKSEFVATVSHDLRSPLTLIRGYATMLQMVGELNEQQDGYIRKIVTGIENMSRLVNNLLDLGRIEAGVGLQLDLIVFQDIVEQVTGALQLQAAQKQIELVVEVPEQASIPLIEADHALIQQAVHNLVENAIKYTENGGKVTVRYGLRESNLLFMVRDTGIGIAPADQTRLFEKFYRVARRGMIQQRGTGLGLAIVKSIAERHGGRVWVESQLGKGSSFYLLIPLRQTSSEQNQSGASFLKNC